MINLKRKVLQLAVVTTMTLAILLAGMMSLHPATLVAQGPGDITSQAILPWSIHIYASPTISPDNTGLYASTGKTPDLCQDGQVTFNAEFLGAPTPFDGTYEAGTGIYVGSLSGFFEAGTQTQSGRLYVECDLPNGDRLVSDSIIFYRYYDPNGSSDVPVLSSDNLAELTIFSNSLTQTAYVIVMETSALPAALPAVVKQISLPYSFRAAGDASAQIFTSDNPMELTLRYSVPFLGGADPLTLRVFEWDAPANSWRNLGQQNLLTAVDPRLSKATTQFTTYVLGSTPLWLDEFTSSAGIETGQTVNIERLVLDDKVVLTYPAEPGLLISKPYTPTLPLKAWHSISYTTYLTAGTQITVSVLGADGQVLKPNVPSGESLADLDPATHPSLRLRVEMSSSSGESPALLAWSILADVTTEESQLYVSPTALQFAATQGVTGTLSHTVSLTHTGTITQWIATTTSEEAAWLTLSDFYVTTPASVTVALGDTRALPAGSYTGQIIFNDTTQSITATVTATLVISSTPPTFYVSPTTLAFGAVESNSPPVTRSLSITSPDTPFLWTSGTIINAEWLSISPVTGTSSASVTVTVDTAGLIYGDYTGTVVFSPTDWQIPAKGVTVTLTITPRRVYLPLILKS
jgi:hypothetical protein